MKGRKILKKTLNYSLRVLESFFAFIFFYLIIALYGEAISVGELKSDGEYYIYVQSNGVHTDVCLPVHTDVVDWDSFISTEPYKLKDSCSFVAIGWGDKGFFLDTPTWAELKTSTLLNAAFVPSPTAMHVMYCQEPKPDKTHKKVYLNKADYISLVRYVKQSFHRKNKHIELIPDKGYTAGDNFYEANDSYHLFRTCNVWTNDALKAAHVKTGLFALFPYGIIGNLK